MKHSEEGDFVADRSDQIGQRLAAGHRLAADRSPDHLVHRLLQVAHRGEGPILEHSGPHGAARAARPE
jgi:hypothetical protein